MFEIIIYDREFSITIQSYQVRYIFKEPAISYIERNIDQLIYLKYNE